MQPYNLPGGPQVFGLVHYTVPMGWMIRESCTELMSFSQVLLPTSFSMEHQHIDHPSSQETTQICVPYSPFLNIVQQAISCTKASIKAYISRPAMQERFAHRNAHLLHGEYRKQSLVQAVERNIGLITIPKCAAWFRHMQTYVPRCFARENLNG